MQMQCLWSVRDAEKILSEASLDENQSSTVLSLEYGDFAMLFTGDLEKEAEETVASYIEEKRFHNTSDREEYLARPFSEIRSLEEQVTRPRAMEEFLFLGLRMMCGVSEQRFLERFGITMEAVYGETLKTLSGEGLLEAYQNGTERFWRLTEHGIDVSNYVLAQFLED